jgi:hypothetical protein
VRADYMEDFQPGLNFNPGSISTRLSEMKLLHDYISARAEFKFQFKLR